MLCYFSNMVDRRTFDPYTTRSALRQVQRGLQGLRCCGIMTQREYSSFAALLGRGAAFLSAPVARRIKKETEGKTPWQPTRTSSTKTPTIPLKRCPKRHARAFCPCSSSYWASPSSLPACPWGPSCAPAGSAHGPAAG